MLRVSRDLDVVVDERFRQVGAAAVFKIHLEETGVAGDVEEVDAAAELDAVEDADAIDEADSV